MPVTFILLDGVRPDALFQANCPNLSDLHARGASTMQATSVMPSITLPCHMSIFHSVPPARHGVTTNTWTPMARPVSGLVEVVKAAHLKTAFIYNWEPLRNLSQPLSLYASYFRDTAYDEDGDEWVGDEAARCLTTLRPDLLFVYLGTVDTIGHDHGWMSPRYLAQLERVDGIVERVLAALPAEYHVIVHSDHGGHERNHGTDAPDDMRIPWLIAGPGVKRGYEITTPVSLLDTAPTIARLLNLIPDPQWEGRVVEEVFE